jgi:hypothetical protein
MDTLICIFWVIAGVAVISLILWFLKSKKKGGTKIETPSSFSTPEDKESEGE